MIKLLNKPHPFIFNAYSVFVPSIITFFIIAVLAPLQFQELTIQIRLMVAISVSLFVALSIVVSVSLLRKLVSKTLIDDSWTVGKEVLLVLSVVFVIIILLSVAVLIVQDNEDPIISLVLKTASITIGVSIFPILILVLFEQYRYQQSQFKKATILTQTLKSENSKLRSSIHKTISSEKKLLLKSDNNDIELQLHPNDLVYIKSDGNYLEVFFSEANQIQKKLLRNSLKKLDIVLPKSIFFRCHNRFIINGNFIVKVEGNARNLELTLKGCPETIPVSRAKAKEIATFLNGLP